MLCDDILQALFHAALQCGIVILDFTVVGNGKQLLAGQRYIKASRRRVYRNKAHYSLDAEDGIEYSACFSNPSPQELIERMERFEQLCHALNSLPDAQGQRVFEHYLLGHSVKAIAAAEGVTERAITAAIQRGLENMKKYLKNVL